MGAQETGSEAGLGVPCVYQDPHLWKEGGGARMAQEKTKATGTMKYIFHTRASCVRPSRLNSLCCLVSGQGLSVPGRLCFKDEADSAAKSNSEGGDSRGCLLTEFRQQQSHSWKGLIHFYVLHTVSQWGWRVHSSTDVSVSFQKFKTSSPPLITKYSSVDAMA